MLNLKKDKVQYKPTVRLRTNSGVQRSGDVQGQLLDCMPRRKLSSTQECDKGRHLKYIKASVEKKISKHQTKYFKEYFLALMCSLKLAETPEYYIRIIRICMMERQQP